MPRYPKTHGQVNEHRGCNLFKRALATLEANAERTYADEHRVKQLLKRLPELYHRCRRNEGY